MDPKSSILGLPIVLGLLPASRGHGWHGHLAVGHVGGGALAVRLHLHHLHHLLHVVASHAHHPHQATVGLPLSLHLGLPVHPSLLHLGHHHGCLLLSGRPHQLFPTSCITSHS